MQGPCPGCVAGTHLLLGGRFRAELLDGLVAVGEVLLGFPGPFAELPFGRRLNVGVGVLLPCGVPRWRDEQRCVADYTAGLQRAQRL